MTCKACGHSRHGAFRAEIAIRPPGPRSLEKPPVWVFPEIRLCLERGRAEFSIPQYEVELLAKGDSPTTAAFSKKFVIH